MPFFGHCENFADLRSQLYCRTILAYSAAGHATRVNYYSSPRVLHPATGTPTGTAAVSDNAALITQNRRAFAAQGDESGGCGAAAPSTTPSTSTTTAATTLTSTRVMQF